jgi:Arc/MetJ-type ribon-helix-helix transcriptional regulator
VNTETTTITVRLAPQDVARLDEMRGDGMSRSAFVRELLRQSGPLDKYATHSEALAILTRLARSGKAAAAIALERALRVEASGEPRGELWRLLHDE